MNASVSSSRILSIFAKPSRFAASRAALLGIAFAGAALVGCGEGSSGTVDARTGEACAQVGAQASCGEDAFIFCDAMADAEDLQWGPCFTAAEMECTPGEVEACGVSGQFRCGLAGGMPTWVDEDCVEESGESGTPLVLRFDDAPIQLIPMGVDGFDIDGVGECDAYDWPSPDSPWLALDRDQSGGIERGAELFGSGTVLPHGGRAAQGFEALAVLDSDGDGAITPSDARWSELRAWADHDGDRMGVGHELAGLDDYGLVRIELDYRIDRQCDARGNCEVERASFVYREPGGALRTGEVVDLHLACQ